MKGVIEEIWENYKKYILIGAGVLLVGVIIWVVTTKSTQPADANALLSSSNETNTASSQSESQMSSVNSTSVTSSSSASSESNAYIYVDVKGAVKHPGIFKVKATMRVDDVINLAGGMDKTADRKHINLAQKLTDQQVVYVPIRGEIKGAPTGTVEAQMDISSAEPTPTDATATSSSGTTAQAAGSVNLNTATKEQLQTLTNIGEKKADQILQYRQAHGKFKSVEELKEVQGIGDKTFETLKSQLSV